MDQERKALEFYVQRSRQPEEGVNKHHERLAEEFFQKTGLMAPGKSAPPEVEMMRDRTKEQEEWDKFLREPLEYARWVIEDRG